MAFKWWLGIPLVVCFIVLHSHSVGSIPVPGTGLGALRFDLLQQTVFHALSTAISKNFTFETWLMAPKPNNGRYNSIVSRYHDPATIEPDYPLVNNTNRYADFNFQIQTRGNLNFFMGGSGQPTGSIFKKYGVLINGGFGVKAGVWTHVAVTVNTPFGSTNPDWVYLYVNGRQVNGMKWRHGYTRNDYSATRPIFLGHYINPQNQFWEGYMDEIRFWNIARTPDQIFNNLHTVFSGLEANLVGYYRCNERYGGLIYPEPRGSRGFVGELQGVTRAPSGVQQLPEFATVLQGEPELLTLVGVDTNYESIEFFVASYPSRGDLFTTTDGITAGSPPVLNQTLGAGISTLIYQSYGPAGNLTDEFLFGAVDTDGQRSPVPAPFIISIIPVVGCDGVNGSGLVYDECGVCGGDDQCVGCDGVEGSHLKYDVCGVCGGNGSSCVCVPGGGTYRGYSESDLDKIVLLYDIELAIQELEDFDAQLTQVLASLASANSSDLNLGPVLDQISSFNAGCLSEFCQNLDTLAGDLNL